MTFTVVDVSRLFMITSLLAAIRILITIAFFLPPYLKKTTTRRSATTTITTRHQPNTNRAAKIEIIAREIAAVVIRNEKETRRAITKPTAQVPRDRRVAIFHQSARKTGIIRQAWTTSRWQQELSGPIIKVNFTLFCLPSV